MHPFYDPWAPAYLYYILLAVPLIGVAWSWRLLGLTNRIPSLLNPAQLAIIAGLFLAISFCLPAGLEATALAGVWLSFTLWQLRWLWTKRYALWGDTSAEVIPILLAAVFLVVAAAWATADRMGFQPLGFDPLIVLLTTVHFHYAGFTLAILVALLPTGRARTRLSWALLPGVGGVAAGITSTQLQGPAWIEMAGVSVMVIIGWTIAWQQWSHANTWPRTSRWLVRIGCLCLVAGLFLALLYGWRFHHQWAWLSLPRMYATHGLLNSLGFGLLSYLGYTYRRE